MKFLMITLLSISFMATEEPNWQFDFEAAKNQAAKEDKTVLIVFSGSDWCKPCIQLHRQLFESEPFLAFAQEKLILIKADFPYRKKNQLSKELTAHNEKLASAYNPEGEFPLAVFTNANGGVVGQFSYDKSKSAEDYISVFNRFIK